MSIPKIINPWFSGGRSLRIYLYCGVVLLWVAFLGSLGYKSIVAKNESARQRALERQILTAETIALQAEQTILQWVGLLHKAARSPLKSLAKDTPTNSLYLLEEGTGQLRRIQGVGSEELPRSASDLLISIKASRQVLQNGGIVLGNSCYAVTPRTTISKPYDQQWLVMPLVCTEIGTVLSNAIHFFDSASSVQGVWLNGPWKDLTSTNTAPFHQTIRRTVPPLDFTVLSTREDSEMADIHQEEKVLGILLCIAVISIGAALLLLARLWKREMQVADLKSEFVANVSHELRTPLTAIQYISDRLILGRVRSEDERKTLYKLLSDETKRLREMIEDVLDLSSLLKGKKIYHRDRADLIELTKEALLRHKQKLDAKPFHVETHWPQEPINVFVDARSVLQAISNLIDNAIKYSGDASRLNVEVRREGRGGQVSIQDFGIGIAPENHEKIFESFYRVETALTKNSEGVGLGLAMVRHIVQGNKGRMTLVSDLNRGSHFTLWFPQEN